MQQQCRQCSAAVTITDDDLKFYNRISPVFNNKKYQIPPPTLCPDCRQQRRMMFRNERSLYKRGCDLCNQSFLSLYPQQTDFPVYCYECWWSDKWNPLDYGQDFDFEQSFFEQFQQLQERVPHLGIVFSHCENCNYTNFINYSRNAYLMFGCHGVEDCCYGWRVHSSHHCFDCTQVDKSQWCYECVDCDECYQLLFGQDCARCSDSAFLYDCRNCQDCLFCVGLRNQKYCIWNQQYSREEFETEKQRYGFSSYKNIEQYKKQFMDFLQKAPHRDVFILQSENVVGDHILKSKNIYQGFHVTSCEDGRYLESCEDLKDSMDCTFCGWPGELVFEGISAGCVNGYNNLFCNTTWSCADVLYCFDCHHSASLFGCIGLRNKNQYCILNKQYSKQEYEQLAGKIVEHMMKEISPNPSLEKRGISPPPRRRESRGIPEWGEFFPHYLSPFAYNETVAQQYFPLSKEEVKERGWSWHEAETPDLQIKKKVIAEKLPDTVGKTPDDILHWAIACSESNRLFKLQKAELEFYRTMHLPISRLHPDVRHNNRINMRRPRKLWDRQCADCEKDIHTPFSPNDPEKVYCESCYLEQVY